MNILVAYIVGGVLALIGTVFACIFILPEKKRAELSKFFQILHDLFNFKHLLLEKLLRVTYVLTTLYCIFSGFFMLFCVEKTYYSSSSYAVTGLLTMLLGPFIVRIVYEFLMMILLLVKNTIDINKKLPWPAREPRPQRQQRPPQRPVKREYDDDSYLDNI